MIALTLAALAAPPAPPCNGIRFSEKFVEWGAEVEVRGCGTGATQSCTGNLGVILPGLLLHDGQRLVIDTPGIPAPGTYTCTVRTREGSDSVIVVVVGV